MIYLSINQEEKDQTLLKNQVCILAKEINIIMIKKSNIIVAQNVKPVNVSKDISKFLISHSNDALRSSTRSSKRNFSLKVREISMDIGAIIPISTPENSKCCNSYL